MRHIYVVFIALLCLTAVSPTQASLRETGPSRINADIASISQQDRQLYIVQFDDAPALTMHQRGKSQLSGSGQFDPDADDVRHYVSKLQAKQNRILLALNLWHNRVYSYGYTFNGVAITLTPDEANRLRQRRGVAKVWKDSTRSVATTDSAAFLGLLDVPGGLRTDLRLTGENIIIGVIDSGITPDHPSFTDRKTQRKVPKICRSEWAKQSLLGMWLCGKFRKYDDVIYDASPARWRGICQAGPGFSTDDCNNKLIGARYYNQGFNQGGAADENEFASPADADGHGTHIASIAAGNEVSASVYGKSVGRISGMAPRARIAVYKACWLEPGASRATCSMADLQQAIEDAVADGVDIINYSIGDNNDSIDDPDDLALLAATEAGVLSVVAAGNDGPSMKTIQSPATTPWVISVGATSRAGVRVAEAMRIDTPEALAKDYESREGGFTPRLRERGPISARLVLANDGSTDTADEDEEGTFYDACTQIENSNELRGNIALIQRGYCNFDQKINQVQSAGALAAIIFSNDVELVIMDGDPGLVNIPAIMIGQADGQLIQQKLLEGDNIEITLDKSLFVSIIDEGNIVGRYSGRGPNYGDPDFLKPDVVAPGTAILGGQTPNVANGFRGELYQYLSGTSQSAPHVAGTAALIMQAHPDWSPAEIKSALMTTSRQNILKEDGQTPANPFDMGAGHIEPNNAVAPGLLYPVEIEEFDAYLCRYGLERIPYEECQTLTKAGYTQDARDINLPSIAITELAGRVEVKRRVTNPGPAAVFDVETNVPDGINLEIEPQRLSLNTGETAEFLLRFTSDGSGLDRWHYGDLNWISSKHRVHSPFVVQPTLFAVSGEQSGRGPTGSVSFPVSFGYTGNYAARINGLFLPCILPSDKTIACSNIGTAKVTDDPRDDYSFAAEVIEPGPVKRFEIIVPPGDDELLRIALFDELTAGNDDLDVYLHYCAKQANSESCEVLDPDNPYASFNANTSNELIDVLNPAPGTWIIDVHGYNTQNRNGTDFRLYAWSFGSDVAAGNLTLSESPTTATAGTTADIVVNWRDLPDGLWLGGITHYDDPDNPDDVPLGLTIIEVNVEVENNALP